MYIISMHSQAGNKIGALIKQKRVNVQLTLGELSSSSGVSSSHLGRIERGERFPSAHVLRKVAKPLGFEEEDLFMLAGFLSNRSGDGDTPVSSYNNLKLDPFVANTLAHENVEVQRAVIGILSLLKSIAKQINSFNH